MRYEGVIPNLERRYKETDSDYMRERDRALHDHPALPGLRAARA